MNETDTDRMHQLACIATAVMEPGDREETRSPTTPAELICRTLPRIRPLGSNSSLNLKEQQPALPNLYSLVGESISSLSRPLQEKQTQHLQWKAQEQELMRRQRQVIALKEKQQAARNRSALISTSSSVIPRVSHPRKAAQHRLQELFMQQQEQQREQDAMRRNLVQFNYHRMLAEEDLERLQSEELAHAQSKHTYNIEQNTQSLGNAVHGFSPLFVASESKSILQKYLPAGPQSTKPPSSTQAPLGQHERASSILKFMLPPAIPNRGGVNVKDITLNELRPHFNKPMAAVAKELGVCITLMKKICRKNGLSRWPHRRIRSLVNRITSLQVVAESVEPSERGRFQLHIASLRKELSDVIQNPNGKSRKAQEYERKKTSDDDEDDSEETQEEDELCCFEDIEAQQLTSRRLAAASTISSILTNKHEI